MINEFISLEKWQEELGKFGRFFLSFTLSSMMKNGYNTYYGYPALGVDGGYLIFKECQYCGKHIPKRGLYSYWVCDSYGAPII